MRRHPRLSYCAEQVRRYDRDRFVTALFAPAARRKALFALYAFNLEVAKTREAVSEPLLGRIRLQWWRESIAGIYDGAPRRHAVIDALAPAVSERDLSRAHFDRLIDAREQDLDDAPPADLDALTAYAEGTSSSLIALALEVLGAGQPAAFEAGRHVGIAWAITGLIRAVPYHAVVRRLYLPADLIAECGLEIGELFDLRPSPTLNKVVERLADAARAHLRSARRLRHRIPKAALPALLPASLADGYLRRIGSAGYDVFDPAAAVAPSAAAWRLTARAALGRF
jgi:phytoene synthase